MLLKNCLSLVYCCCFTPPPPPSPARPRLVHWLPHLHISSLRLMSAVFHGKTRNIAIPKVIIISPPKKFLNWSNSCALIMRIVVSFRSVS